MDTLLPSYLFGPRRSRKSLRHTVCVSWLFGMFRSCPQLCPNKESTTFRRRGLTPVFERLFREAVERVGELVTDLLTGEVG